MIRLSSHRLPFSLSIGGTPIPPVVIGGGGAARKRPAYYTPNVYRDTGTTRIEMHARAQTAHEQFIAGVAAFGWQASGMARFVAGDDIDLLGIEDEELL